MKIDYHVGYRLALKNEEVTVTAIEVHEPGSTYLIHLSNGGKHKVPMAWIRKDHR